jgi:probable F420-dependent oxidoreductase
MNRIRIGAKLPDFGPIVNDVPLSEAARCAEAAGFDSVWVSDHVVMVREIASAYPYSRDGDMTWDPAQPRFDALVSMAVAAATTQRVEVGVAVLVAALRNPLVLAKQLATLDVVSGGRVVVGVGAGWLAEEFEALEVPFDSRGARLDEWIDIARDCWTGTPRGHSYQHYELPDDVLCYPTPVRDIPILVGGMSQPALGRAGQRGDGWLAFQSAGSVDIAALAAGMELLRKRASAAERKTPRVVVRLTGPFELAARTMPDLASIGISEVIVDVDWQSERGPKQTLETLLAALN